MKFGRNVAFNLAGLVVPVLLAFVCIPPLIRRLGVETFGLLTLVWVLLGYFSLFDIGIGRALTRILAEQLARRTTERLNVWLRTATTTSFGLGILFGLGLALSSGYLAQTLAKSAPDRWPDVQLAIILIGAALPFVTATSALRGALEARQYFGLTNSIRIGMGFFSYAGPLLLSLHTTRLPAIVAFLLVGRLVFFGLHLVFVLKKYAEFDAPKGVEKFFDRALMRPLLAVSGWMAVSNFVSPLLTYLDRFLVSALVGSAVLAFYTTPYEAIMKVTVIPDALNGVLFPALVTALARDQVAARRLFVSCFRLLLAFLAPLIAAVVVIAPYLLDWWVGAEFRRQSTPVLQILAVGVLINSLARLPFTALQSAGRPDLTAKLHLGELPVFLLALWLLTSKFGITGAALAWTLRVTVDFLMLEYLRRRFLPAALGFGALQIAALLIFAAILVMAMKGPIEGPPLAWAACIATLALVASIVRREDLQALRSSLRRRSTAIEAGASQ